MKYLALALLFVLFNACGKKEVKKNELKIRQNETERNPYTGQIDVLRASLINIPIYINETEQIITQLESRTHSPNGEGYFSCHAFVRAGTRLKYGLVSSGQTLLILTPHRDEHFERPITGNSVLGQWSRTEFKDGLIIKTTMTFPDIRTMHLQVECSRR